MNMIGSTLSPSAYDSQADFFKALAHPVRLLILNALRDGEHCVCHLEAHLGLRQAYLSQQLAVLRKEGLVELRRDGWNRFYRVTQPEIFTVLDACRSLLPEGQATLNIEPNPACPCPCCAGKRGQVG